MLGRAASLRSFPVGLASAATRERRVKSRRSRLGNPVPPLERLLVRRVPLALLDRKRTVLRLDQPRRAGAVEPSELEC